MNEGKAVATLLPARRGVVDVIARKVWIATVRGTRITVVARYGSTIAAIPTTRAAKSTAAILGRAFGIQ